MSYFMMNIYPVLLFAVVPAWQVLWTCLVFNRVV
uniref:Uncharacterized protein n=1 Tax=Anguilla anguilla TaxID=7936 RepID=A0A0E9S7H8_ANGAN